MKFPLIVFFAGVVLVGLSLIALKFFGKELNLETSIGKDETTALLVVSTSSMTVTRDGTPTTLSDGTHDLLPGDNVKTDEAGTGYIVFSDNSTLSLDKNSEITLEEVNQSDDTFIIKVTQLAGRTWSRVENLFGKKTEYEVETPNTIAAVRGTVFGCDVTSISESTCYAIEHSISLKLKNLDSEDNEIVLDEGNQFTNNDEEIDEELDIEEIKRKVSTLDEKIETWKTYNECLTEKSEELLNSDEQKVIDFLKENIDKLVCGDEVTDTEVPTETVTPTPEPVDTPAASIGTISFSQQGSNLVCAWTALNATSYAVSISTVAGAGSTPWVTRTIKTYTRSDVSSGNTYYCNVIAKGDGGNSSVKASKGVYFDLSTGSIDTTFPASTGYYYGAIGATGKFYSMSFSNLRIKYSIQRSDNNKYLRVGTGWADGLFWNVFSPVQTAADSYSLNGSPGGVDGPFDVNMSWVLFNNANGKVLDSVSFTVPNNW